jgi:hypothetical protein
MPANDDLTNKVAAIINGPPYTYMYSTVSNYSFSLPTSANNVMIHTYGGGGGGAHGAQGAGGVASTNFTYTTGQPWGSGAGPAGINVDGAAKFNGDIIWKGRDLGRIIDTIEKRLAILTPDPSKLAHFEALQKAYDNYKVLEALCEIPETTDETK